MGGRGTLKPPMLKAGVHWGGTGGGDTGQHHVSGGHPTTELIGVGSVDHSMLLRDTWQRHNSCVRHSGNGGGADSGTMTSRAKIHSGGDNGTRTRRAKSHSGDRRREDSKLDPEIEANVKVPSSTEKVQQSETLQI